MNRFRYHTPGTIAERTGLNVRTVRRYLKAHKPEWRNQRYWYRFDRWEGEGIINDLLRRKRKNSVSPLLGLARQLKS